MKQFEINKLYRVNSSATYPQNIIVLNRTKNYVTLKTRGNKYRLKIRSGFFGNCEHLLIPTEYNNITLFCSAANVV